MSQQNRIAFYHQLCHELNVSDTEENRDTFYMALDFARAGLLPEEGVDDLRRETRDNFIDMTNDEREVPILI
jgi:hypothetical protein